MNIIPFGISSCIRVCGGGKNGSSYLLVQIKGLKGRYVRLYSNGSTADDLNRYTEVEVYGLPAK